MSTSSTWIPRPATSVATRTGTRPAAKWAGAPEGRTAPSWEGGGPLPPRRLAKVAVDGGGAYVVSAQLRDQTVGLALGAREDQRPGNASGDGARHLHSVHLMDREEPVVHLVHRLGGRRHLVSHRVIQVVAHE